MLIPKINTNDDVNQDADLAEVIAQMDGNKALNWVNAEYTAPDCVFKGTLEGPPEDGEIKTRFQFFKKMITNYMFQNLADQTNIYSLQRDGTSISTSNKEIEILIGLYFRMGIVQMPRISSYWETETRYNLIADAMSRNRFEKLVSTLHFRREKRQIMETKTLVKDNSGKFLTDSSRRT